MAGCEALMLKMKIIASNSISESENEIKHFQIYCLVLFFFLSHNLKGNCLCACLFTVLCREQRKNFLSWKLNANFLLEKIKMFILPEIWILIPNKL